MPALEASVGHPNGTNKVHDVALIQVMLRVIKSPKGRPYVTFKYDGTCGVDRGTHKAIKAFQTDYKTLKGPPAETLGRVDKNGPSFKKMVALLPASHKGLMALEGQTLVYLASSDAAAKSSGAGVTGNSRFRADFKTKLAALIREMYKKYKIVLSVVPRSGGFRSFDEQQALFKKGGVTNAGPGESNHNFGNGADLGFQGFTWILGTGAAQKDNHWLSELAKTKHATASALWKLRNKLTTLRPTTKAGDLIHLQTFDDSKVSMRQSLVQLLNEVGNMKWEVKGREYRSNYGLGDDVFDIGRGQSTASNIWENSKSTCDVSGTNLAKALNQTISRRKKTGGKLPANEEQIYNDLMSDFKKPPESVNPSDIVGTQYNKMRKWLKKDFELAEANYDKWKPVDSSGTLMK